jgi:hypothetical protein
MGRHILAALLGGLLVLGVSTAFAEEPQVSDQEILKAWGQAQTDVQQIADAATPELNDGPQLLTDEDLDKVNAAGLGFLAYKSAKYAVYFGCSLLCNTLHSLKNRLHPD